jgi:hypothetical protein
MSLDILTLDEVKDIIGLPASDTADDQKIMRLIPQATRRLEVYLNNFVVQRSHTEHHYGLQGQWWLERYPIASITSIADPASNTIEADEYRLEEEKGLIISTTGLFTTAMDTSGRRSRWEVIYVGGKFAGIDDVTDEYKQALALLLIERFERPEPGIISRKMGDLTVTYSSQEELVPPEVAALVGGYASISF